MSWNKGISSTLDSPGPGNKRLRWLKSAFEYEGDECQLWPFPVCQNGYGGTYCEGVFVYAHRLICQHAKGLPPSPKHHAAHSCGDKRCVTKRHLSWKTNSENQLDRRAHGTAAKTRRKLTPEQVAEIHAVKGTEPILALAARFAVNEATIRQIYSGKIWSAAQRDEVS
jgi:hypothetical protein